jgi:hypothetical protein
MQCLPLGHDNCFYAFSLKSNPAQKLLLAHFTEIISKWSLARPATIPRLRVAETERKANSYQFVPGHDFFSLYAVALMSSARKTLETWIYFPEYTPDLIR